MVPKRPIQASAFTELRLYGLANGTEHQPLWVVPAIHSDARAACQAGSERSGEALDSHQERHLQGKWARIWMAFVPLLSERLLIILHIHSRILTKILTLKEAG